MLDYWIFSIGSISQYKETQWKLDVYYKCFSAHEEAILL